MRILLGVVMMLAVDVAGAQTGVVLPIQRAEAAVDPLRIAAQVKFLSDDLLEGRYPGLRGGELAAKYIVAQFASYGLTPAGDNGTFLQQINFVGMTAKPAETFLEVYKKEGAMRSCSGPMDRQHCRGGRIELKFGEDFVVSNQTLTAMTDIDAPIVFVGYGATAPEFGWDDYAGIDVKGKVILCIVGDPPSNDPKFFGGEALTYYGRWTYKFEQAARKGAVGALIIHRADLASYPWAVVKNSNSGEKTFLRDDANPRLQAASWVQLDVAKKMFEASGMTLDGAFDAAGKRGFKAVELPLRLKAHVSSTVRAFQSPNVVGVIPGRQTVLAHRASERRCPPKVTCIDDVMSTPDQAVIFSAHYDHLGFVPGMAGDNIYNGAADNGTGSGMLLEMARAMTSAGVKPPHSIIFAAVTAEEQGLLGSEYLGQHPPVPAAQIALDINYDELLPIGVQHEIDVNGAQRLTIYPMVQATARKFGLTIVPDPQPSHGSYYRSDHFSLSRVGVPAFSVDAGTLYKGHDHAWGLAQKEDFDGHRYHNFSDNYDPSWDFTGDANLVRFGMDLGWQVVSAPKTVEWLKGDEFEAARLASERK